MTFKNTMAKLAIGSLDDSRISVEAHYNPKELGAAREVPWSTRNQSKDAFDIEFTGSQPRTMELEMLFDCYEQEAGVTVQDQLDVLEVLANPRDPHAKDAELLRPHYCVVTWGEKGMHPMRCVILSLATKVTMFATDGTPRRATANVKIREVRIHRSDVDAGFDAQVTAAARRAARREV